MMDPYQFNLDACNDDYHSFGSESESDDSESIVLTETDSGLNPHSSIGSNSVDF